MAIYLKLLLTAIFWGGTFIAGRIISRSMDPYIAAFLRFSTASILLILLIRIREGYLPGLKAKQILPIILLGLTGVFTYNVLFFSGLHTVTAGRASLIIALNPIAISLLSSIIFKEKLTYPKLFGILVSVTGAMVVITHGDLFSIFDKPLGMGELFIFGCVISWVAYSLIGKMIMSGLSPLLSVGYSALAGSIALFVPATYNGLFGSLTSYSLEEWISVFYLSIFGTVIGFIWYYQGIKQVGPMKASVFINFVPVSAIILAFLILGEPVTISLLTGAVLVICGVLLTNFSNLIIDRIRNTSSIKP
jgi:drug/metabolite transporter (DMT)-like permease